MFPETVNWLGSPDEWVLPFSPHADLMLMFAVVQDHSNRGECSDMKGVNDFGHLVV